MIEAQLLSARQRNLEFETFNDSLCDRVKSLVKNCEIIPLESGLMFHAVDDATYFKVVSNSAYLSKKVQKVWGFTEVHVANYDGTEPTWVE
jgi:hypothetical protein